MDGSRGKRHLGRLLRRRPSSWIVAGWAGAAVVSLRSWMVDLRAGELDWVPILALAFSLMMVRYMFDHQQLWDLVARLNRAGPSEGTRPDPGWGQRHIRRVLRRRPPPWSRWVWVAPGALLLAWSAVQFREGIAAAAPPGMAGFSCLLVARYLWEMQLYYDRVTELEDRQASPGAG